MKKYLLITALSLLFTQHAFAREMVGRLGIGMTNQAATDMPAISFKVMNSKSMGLGGLLAMSTSDNGGGHAAGLKLYRVFFDEPQLNFYGSLMGALLKRKGAGDEGSGFQVDITLGSEFAFTGLDSLGFSFETGVSMNKIDDFVLETVGYHFVTASIHFYL